MEAGRNGGGTGFSASAESRPLILADWCDAPSTTNAGAMAVPAVGGSAGRPLLGQRQVHPSAPRTQAACKGAGAKGVTFCNLADPEARRIACVVDINPAKQGKFVAGTGHPIVSPEQAVARGVTAALVLNPNYLTEVTEQLARRGARTAVFDLMRAA